jgi:hypothetical protein
VTYIAAADFRERTVKPHCTNLILGEADGLDAYIDLIIAQVTTQVELDLADDFEPPNPDTDEVISVDGSGWERLYLPRRVRSLTTLETRALEVYTVQASTTWRLRKSLNAAGTAMIEGRTADWLDAVSLSTSVWPWGADTVRLTGKFGWGAVPDDIKRLVALKTYDLIKGNGDPLSTIVQRQTLDATITYGPSAEVTAIMSRYQRTPLVVG